MSMRVDDSDEARRSESFEARQGLVGKMQSGEGEGPIRWEMG